jgi:hypothetical protein
MQAKTIIASAAVGFAIGAAAPASSGTAQTLPPQALHVTADEVDAGIIGGTWLSAGVGAVYVDGYAHSAGSMFLDLIRFSWSGTRTEAVQSTSFWMGQFEIYIQPLVMRTNPDRWDYYTFGAAGLPGSGMFTSQVVLYGIGVWGQ